MITPRIDGGVVTWDNDSETINIPCENSKFAIYNSNNEMVYVMCKSEELNIEQLNLYKADGSLFASIPPPEGFSFYYMLPYEGLGVSVICSTDNPAENRPDWHFKFDDISKTLIRHCPAY
ncbi:hypothetical protein [Alkalimonas amylolytica]|uniref:Uncharacterized protein n=1 Tax=Alkalimonas amylolytica TaxID=152573 RepID=A0A1H4G6N8_ALKAM|nr:hypothetical protein [Alkalimonas amylolytica]SEB05249.1 hypothetical protein SAMN04488051_1252 [Alkalimonas amylolytica]